MNTPDDRDLEKLLSDDGGEWGALYRKLSRVEPPRRLDRNVLDEAARAVRGHVPRRQRWLVGIGSTAGLVLAAGIAWHVGHQSMPTSSTPMQQAPAASAPQRHYVPVLPLDESTRRAAPKADAALEPVPSPAPPAAVAAKPRAPAQPQSGATPQASAKLEMRKPAAPAAPPPVPASESMQAPAADAAIDTNAKAASAPASESESPATPERRRVTSPEALTRSAELHNDARLAPDAWIRRIQWLLEQDRRDQALESLRLLRRTHPDVELPDDLQELQ